MKTTDFLNWKALAVAASLPFLAAALSRPSSLRAADQPTASSEIPAGVATSQSASTNSDAVQMQSTPALPPNVPLYGGTAEVVKLAQAGVGKDVILTYITNANLRFALTSDQIIYLNDLGVSGDVVNAMLQHDAAQNSAAPAVATEPAPATNLPDQTAQVVPEVAAPVSQPTDYTAVDNPPVYDNPNPAGYPVAGDAGYFYDSLQPYGTWLNVAGYGLCWQPTAYAGDHNWRPYGDRGRWLYTDNGWYWHSDYSWGWAAFHYGRWLQHDRAGWVWVPNKVWGPAWVSWRATSDYAGWAPLPPSAVFEPGVGLHFHGRRVDANFDFGLPSSLYTFIPTARLSDYYPVTYGVSRVATASIFNQSVVVNNATDEHQQVVSRGIEPWRVVAAGGTPVRQAILRETPENHEDRRFRTDRIDVRGNSLVIFRPHLPEASGNAVEGTAGSSHVHVNYMRQNDERPALASAVPVPSVAYYSTVRTPAYSAAPSAAHTAPTILLPRGPTVSASHVREASAPAATENSWTTRLENSQSTTVGDTRPIPRASYLTPNTRQGASYDTESSYRARTSDSPVLTPGSSYRVSNTTGGQQTSGLLLPRSSAAYGLGTSTPATSRSTSYGQSLSAPTGSRATILLPTQSYSPPAAPTRSYQAPATYSAPAPSSGSHSFSSSGNGNGNSNRGR